MTKIEFQPYANFTIFQSAKGKFAVRSNTGMDGTNGHATIEQACRSAQAHFGNLIRHMGQS